MKVENIGQSQVIEQTRQTPKNESAEVGADFSAMLQDEVSAGGEQAASIPEIVGFSPMPTINVPSISQVSGDPTLANRISAIEDVLASLQSLEQTLRGSNSPKQIESVISQISSVAASLQEQVAALPSDGNLRDIAQEADVLAYVESVKWSRGDYI